MWKWQLVQIIENGGIITIPILGDDSPCELLGFLKFIDEGGRVRVPYWATTLNFWVVLHFCRWRVWLKVWLDIAYIGEGQSGIWQLLITLSVCLFHDKSCVMVTPRYLTELTIWIGFDPRLRSIGIGWGEQITGKMFVFVQFNVRPWAFVQFRIWLMSSWMMAMSSGEFMGL